MARQSNNYYTITTYNLVEIRVCEEEIVAILFIVMKQHEIFDYFFVNIKKN
jgi:hypothetical protein